LIRICYRKDGEMSPNKKDPVLDFFNSNAPEWLRIDPEDIDILAQLAKEDYPDLSGQERIQKMIKSQGYRPYTDGIPAKKKDDTYYQNDKGRFPANVIFDEFTGKILDEQTGTLTSGKVSPEGFKGEYTGNVFGKYANNTINPDTVYGDSGGASRFFYCPKADNYERNKGLKGFELKEPEHNFGTKLGEPRSEMVHTPKRNFHPTVKPIDLMRYLVKCLCRFGIFWFSYLYLA